MNDDAFKNLERLLGPDFDTRAVEEYARRFKMSETRVRRYLIALGVVNLTREGAIREAININKLYQTIGHDMVKSFFNEVHKNLSQENKTPKQNPRDPEIPKDIQDFLDNLGNTKFEGDPPEGDVN